jgi:hypothetical protein
LIFYVAVLVLGSLISNLPACAYARRHKGASAPLLWLGTPALVVWLGSPSRHRSAISRRNGRYYSRAASLNAFIAVLFASSLASAQQPTGGGPGPVLGIVEIPKMFSFDPALGGAPPHGTVRIYTRPDSDSKMLAEITGPQAIDDAEYGYEEAGALVYGRERGYFLIRTSRGVGWLAPDDAGSFHPLETLIASDLSYLTDAWDGFVRASPGSADRSRVAEWQPDWKEKHVRVKRARTINGNLWLEIEVISHSVCESNEPPTIKARGWIKAHDAAGTPTVWFPSRGC